VDIKHSFNKKYWNQMLEAEVLLAFEIAKEYGIDTIK